MMFRRKPTSPVDAEQYTDQNNPPRGVWFNNKPPVHGLLAAFVTTTQGRDVQVSIGEWIVAEQDGKHFYPVADTEFQRLYEPDTNLDLKRKRKG